MGKISCYTGQCPSLLLTRSLLIWRDFVLGMYVSSVLSVDQIFNLDTHCYSNTYMYTYLKEHDIVEFWPTSPAYKRGRYLTKHAQDETNALQPNAMCIGIHIVLLWVERLLLCQCKSRRSSM